jgi:hypothetical protein
MVEIAPPAGWSPAAAIGAASMTPDSVPTQIAIDAPAATVHSPVAVAHAFFSPIVLWSASGLALLSLAGLGAAFAWRGSDGPVVTQQLSPAVVAHLASTERQNEKQLDTSACSGLAAAIDAQSRIDLSADDPAPSDDQKAKPADPIGTAQTPAAVATQSPATASAAALESIQNETAQAVSTPASTPRTLTLEPISAEATTAALAIEQGSRESSPQYPPVSNDVASSNVQLLANASAALPPESAPPKAAAMSHPLLRFGPRAQDAVRRTNIADQVSVPIKSFDMSAAPLSRVLETLASMAAVPIAVDPDVLSAAGVSLDSQVTVSAHDTTVGKLLGTVLREHDLTCKVSDGQLVIVEPDNRRSSTP